MRRGFLLSLVLVLLSGLVPFTGTAAAAPAVCPDAVAPPPPVDTSEEPPPGVAAPAPLPVPETAVGGARMGECGVVTPTGSANALDTTAASWVLQDLDTGEVLAAKNPHARERPASLIKTLLALVVLREMTPDQVIVATAEDADQECTCVGLVAGGRYTVDLLLHGLLMHSGNDVAHAFATALGGVPVAVRKMNALAAELGATDTRAATPSGLDGPGMSASAYDMSLIFNYAMKQPEFATSILTRAVQIPDQPGKPAFSIVNDNKLLGTYPGFLGGKTGFTDDARHTYVGGAEQGGRRIAVVMMRAENRPTPVVNQAKALLDYGFALMKTDASPVGQLVSPQQAAEATGSGSSGVDGVSNANAAGQDPFGVTGWILTVVVALIIVAGFVIGHYRKKGQQAAHR
ncbi:D-alanyl-D-alanine carboxypeptidase (penicillin-binding protein 5/6) [Amycolatopsis endophytica]|uniref:D-alanyl-D-alanine carboxypeptidase (Penicillin-binding protein 5/6) n=1 Tax=Amycolatopsis endophytica TaxID=860233 RepID=A0A853AY95_9PSEU|nr:D-alanyl-D-alanine carboxypeptidase (penicillin-binding protein 5/6) [Amycolatopsis endophytica]